MIRIYLDWSVISNLKKEEYAAIKNFIAANKQHLQFPYSPAHFSDLMKSYRPDTENKYFQEDLAMLEYLSENYLLRWEGENTEGLIATPRNYLEEFLKTDKNPIDIEKLFDELDDELSFPIFSSLKSLLHSFPMGAISTSSNENIIKMLSPNFQADTSFWDFMKNITNFSNRLLGDKIAYKGLRQLSWDNGLKLSADAGNWDFTEVIDRVNLFMSKLPLNSTQSWTFLDLVKSSFPNKKEPINSFEFHTTAYLCLDMMGYKSDKLPKPTDSMQNILNDAQHSFYAAHCDFFVVQDKGLAAKTKVLFEELKISTTVISPSEFISTLQS